MGFDMQSSCSNTHTHVFPCFYHILYTVFVPWLSVLCVCVNLCSPSNYRVVSFVQKISKHTNKTQQPQEKCYQEELIHKQYIQIPSEATTYTQLIYPQYFTLLSQNLTKPIARIYIPLQSNNAPSSKYITTNKKSHKINLLSLFKQIL